MFQRVRSRSEKYRFITTSSPESAPFSILHPEIFLHPIPGVRLPLISVKISGFVANTFNIWEGTRKFALKLSTQFDQQNITTYVNTKEAGIYNQNYFVVDGKLGYSTSRDISIGLGTRFEWIKYNPSITSAQVYMGTDNFPTSYIYFNHNSLDRPVYPKKGIKIRIGRRLGLYPGSQYTITFDPT